MRRPWFVVGVLVTWGAFGSLGAQPVKPDSKAEQDRQQKSAYYTQIEYQRCRSDVLELLAKGDATEQRVVELEAEVRKLTDELTQARENSSAKPAN